MIFLWKENENFLRQHCSRFQDTRLCPIWAYLNKLCHECGHNIRHLARKPWIFIDDSSFLRTLFQENWRIPSLYFFVLTRSHIMTPREGFPFIWFVSNFVCRFQYTVKKRRTWPFVPRGWILGKFCCIYDEIGTCVPKYDFF